MGGGPGAIMPNWLAAGGADISCPGTGASGDVMGLFTADVTAGGAAGVLARMAIGGGSFQPEPSDTGGLKPGPPWSGTWPIGGGGPTSGALPPAGGYPTGFGLAAAGSKIVGFEISPGAAMEEGTKPGAIGAGPGL